MPALKTGVVFNLGTRPINVHIYQDLLSHQKPKTQLHRKTVCPFGSLE